MIAAWRGFIRRHWPRLRLRTILLATLIFVAALPGVGAVFLRVYENTLVRQTEAELVAQGAALAATAQSLWPGSVLRIDPNIFRPEPPRIDLNSTPVLPERPDPMPVSAPPDPEAVKVARQMQPILDQTRQTTLAAIQLLDAKGNVVSGTEVGHSYGALPEVAAALRGVPDTVLRRNGSYRQVYRFEWLTRAAAIRVHHVRPVIVNDKVAGAVLLSRSARALFRGIYEDIGKIALATGLILATLIVLAGLLSRGIARPIEVLSAATRNLITGHGAPPAIPATAAIEIQALYRDFATMAEAIERRSRYLRDFAYAVSHEFKTPLAAITGTAELLQDHVATMSEPERKQFLANIASDATRLTQLLTGVLDLARADMTAPNLVESSDLCTPLLRLADAYRGSELEVRLSLPDRLAPVRLPTPAIETCLSNLLENSRRAGAAKVEIRVSYLPAAVQIDVEDDGPGIAERDRHRIFEPFFTTRRETGGTGLGLPIVKSLLSAHGGEIELLDAERGAHFRLKLPAAV
ncbi:MAG TPA: HAMP domain-containing sensor histidine kinase [Rhizomicrobium sp.]|nr:HAMP domain-containing sensor histidine kinase [Rhizomicrobium sp.]